MEVSFVYVISKEKTNDQLDDFRKTVGAVRGYEDICYGGVQYVSFLTSYFTSGLMSHGDYHIVHSMMAARS